MSMSESSADENISSSGEPTAVNDMTPGAEPAHDEDVIVIQRARFVVAVAGLTGFLIGLGVGYFTFSYAFNRGFALARSEERRCRERVFVMGVVVLCCCEQ